MGKLVPQIRHWLRTGFVAPGKIISLNIPQLYSICARQSGQGRGVRIVVGDYTTARRFHSCHHGQRQDRTHGLHLCRGAVEDLIALFGKAPRGYAYDRGGYSAQNVERLGKLGVRNIGLAPRGRAPWEVQGR